MNVRQAEDIAEKVSFRGPDNRSVRIYNDRMERDSSGTTVLLFNRLAIIDLDARSNQPFEDDRYTLIFNGEIYNYRQLKTELQSYGQQFHTESDTEVLFQALRRWGADALPRLNGMFAFCWLDRTERSFLLGRDRVGIKPIYYRFSGKSLAFASELDSVLRLSGDLPDIEPKAVHAFLWTQFIPSPFTIVKDVWRLPPGHYLRGDWSRLETGLSISPQPYWDAYRQAVSAEAVSGDPAELETILAETLSRQMIADVPLGLFLSSGVDSSLLTALVNRHFAGSGDVNLFTVAFTEATVSDESRDAADFVKGFNNPHLHTHTLVIDPAMIGEHLDKLYDYFDEPFGDHTALLNWAISIKAKQYVTVALSGDGADELFWGYGRYGRWQNAGISLPGNRFVGRPWADLLKPILPPGYWRTGAALQLERDPVQRHFNLFLSPALAGLRERPVYKEPIWALEGIDAVRDRGDLVSLLDIKTYLADAMLHKVDRASMAASLEVRVPYLDNRVIDYALALPLAAKSSSGFPHKAILKHLLQRLAPHYPAHRPKKGFNFPIDSWLRFQWREKVMELVNDDNLTALGLDAQLYGTIVRKYYAGDRNNCIPVWYLLNLCLWYRKYRSLKHQVI